MKTEKALLEARAIVREEMEVLTKDMQGNEPTQAQRRAWLNGKAEYDRLTDEIAELQAETESENILYNAGRSTGAKAHRPIIGEMAKALYLGANGRAPADAHKSFDLTNGGAAIQDPKQMAEFIELLKAENPIFDYGARMLVGANYQQFPRQLTDPEINWFTEGDAALLPDSSATIDAVKFDFKLPAIHLVASNLWLEDSGTLGAEIISRMAVAALRDAILQAVLHGVAASAQPVGLDSIVGVQSVSADGYMLDSYAKIVQAVQKLLAANVPLENIAGIIPPSIWAQLNNLTGTDNQPLMMPQGLRDVRMAVSSAVREDYEIAADDDHTRAYFGDWSNLWIASNGGPRVTILREQRATQFQTSFLCHMRFDVAAVRPSAFCILKDVHLTEPVPVTP